MKMDFESARQKYKPEIIKFLLMAEAPPRERFFYCQDVKDHDHLFLETMKVLYPNDCLVGSVRQQKHKFLERFKDNEFYLIDASDTPMKDTHPAQKRKQIKRSLHILVEKVRGLISKDTKIILISSTVYKVCCDRLKAEGFNIINECVIPFSAYGWQEKFRGKLSALLIKHGWKA